MDGKHEGRGTVPGGGEYFIIDHHLNIETLEGLAEDTLNPDTKTLQELGERILRSFPIWAKGGLMDTVEKTASPFERKSLLLGAALGRARDILGVTDKNEDKIPAEMVSDRQMVDYDYFEELLRDREKYSDKIPYIPHGVVRQMGLELKQLADARPQERQIEIITVATEFARRNLGVDPKNRPSNDAFQERIGKEMKYIQDALGTRNYVTNVVLKRA